MKVKHDHNTTYNKGFLRCFEMFFFIAEDNHKINKTFTRPIIITFNKTLK